MGSSLIVQERKLVFVDECGTHTSLAPLYGYSPKGERMTLRCSECGEKFTAYGDVALECIAYGWSKDTGEKGYRETPEGIKRLFEHEHDMDAFVETTTGLPFMDRRVTGLDLGGPLG